MSWLSILGFLGEAWQYIAMFGGALIAYWVGGRAARRKREIKDLRDERDTLLRKDEIEKEVENEADDSLRDELGIPRD